MPFSHPDAHRASVDSATSPDSKNVSPSAPSALEPMWRALLHSRLHFVGLVNVCVWILASCVLRFAVPHTHIVLAGSTSSPEQAVYASVLLATVSIMFFCGAIVSSSVRPAKRRLLAGMAMSAALSNVCLGLSLGDAAYCAGEDGSNLTVLAFAGVGYWCFIIPWRSTWRAFITNDDEAPGGAVWPMLLYANLSAAAFILPRLYRQPAVILACHLPMLAGQFATNEINVRVAWAGMRASDEAPFSSLYTAASVLAFASGTVHVTEMAYLFGGASFFVAEAHLVFSVLARILGCLCIVLYSIVKLDEQTRLRAELSAARARASAADKADEERKKFLRYIFHELRVPLNSVKLGLQLLLEEDDDGSQPLPPDTGETLQLLYQATETVMAIVNDSLDLAKMEAGALHLSVNAVHVKELVVNAMAQMWPFANGQHAALSATIEGGVPFIVLGDGPRLSQCLTNFLSNGIKFVEERKGQVTLRVRVVQQELGAGRGTQADTPTVRVGHAEDAPPPERRAWGGAGRVGPSSPYSSARPAHALDALRFLCSPSHPALTSLYHSDSGTSLLGGGIGGVSGGMQAAHTPVVDPYAIVNMLRPETVKQLREGGYHVQVEPPLLPSSPLVSSAPGMKDMRALGRGALDVLVAELGMQHACVDGASNSLALPARGAPPSQPLPPSSLPVLCFVEFAVIDNGCGIEEHEVQLLYQPFVQVEAGTRQKGKGTGLGLSIVKQIVTAHGGSVSVASKPGAGSTFAFTLPCIVLQHAKGAGDGGRDATLLSVTVAEEGGRQRGSETASLLARYSGEGGTRAVHSAKPEHAPLPREDSAQVGAHCALPSDTSQGAHFSTSAFSLHMPVSSRRLQGGGGGGGGRAGSLTARDPGPSRWSVSPKGAGSGWANRVHFFKDQSGGVSQQQHAVRSGAAYSDVPRLSHRADSRGDGGECAGTSLVYSTKDTAQGSESHTPVPRLLEVQSAEVASVSGTVTSSPPLPRHSSSATHTGRGGVGSVGGLRVDVSAGGVTSITASDMRAGASGCGAGQEEEGTPATGGVHTSESGAPRASSSRSYEDHGGDEEVVRVSGVHTVLHASRTAGGAEEEGGATAAPFPLPVLTPPALSCARLSSAEEGRAAHFLPGGAGLVVDCGPLAPSSSSASSSSTTSRMLRWLFVDDIPSNRRFLSRLLQRRFPGSSVFDECENGAEAVALCSRVHSVGVVPSTLDAPPPGDLPLGQKALCAGWPYDVVAMDGSMPVMDGFEATRALRALGYPGLILGVTGNVLEADRVAFIRAGVNEVVPKPVKPEELVAHVLAWYGPEADASRHG